MSNSDASVEPSRKDSESSLAQHLAWMALLILPMIALSQTIAYFRVDVVDDQMFAFFGWRIANGGTVYLDVWDNKPPGVYWINALAMLLSGGHYLGVIAMCSLAMIVAHAAFFITAASVYFRGAAAFTTILLGFFLTHAYYTGGTNRTETYLVACELVAAALYMRGFVRDRWWRWFLAGLCCGAAFLFKQVGLAAWGSMGLHLIVLLAARQITLRQAVTRGGLLIAGLATALALACGCLASQGALGEALFATFGFNRAYFAGGATRFPYNLVNYYLLRHHIHPILLLPLLMALTSVIHAFLWWLRPQHRPADIAAPLEQFGGKCPYYMFFFTTWTLVAAWGALIGPSGFRHYLVAMIPPLMLTAGYLVNVLRTEVRLLQRLQQRAWVAAAFVAMGFFAYQSVVFQFAEVAKVYVARGIQNERAEWEIVGERVAALTQPGDRIQCTGYMPGVYLVAKRVNASRYATMEKLSHASADPISAGIAREVEQTVKANPPALVVMPSSDFYAMIGKTPEGQRREEVLKSPPPVPIPADWLQANYVLVEDLPKVNVLLFLRRDRFDPAVHHDLSAILSKMRGEGS